MADTFINASGLDVPARACIMLTDGDPSRLHQLTATQPSIEREELSGRLFFNGPTQVLHEEGEVITGQCLRATSPVWALYDENEDPPEFFSEIGPVTGYWHLSSVGEGFIVVGKPDTTEHIVLVVEKPVSISESDDGFPAGTGGCDCGHCIDGRDLTATENPPTICCRVPLVWTMINPWGGGSITLKWAGGDVWTSDRFEKEVSEGCSDEFVWVMDLSFETLRLTTATDNCGAEICLIYKVSSSIWECQCDIAFKRWKFNGIPISELSCFACVKPQTPFVEVSTETFAIPCLPQAAAGVEVSKDMVFRVTGFSGALQMAGTISGGCPLGSTYFVFNNGLAPEDCPEFTICLRDVDVNQAGPVSGGATCPTTGTTTRCDDAGVGNAVASWNGTVEFAHYVFSDGGGGVAAMSGARGVSLSVESFGDGTFEMWWMAGFASLNSTEVGGGTKGADIFLQSARSPTFDGNDPDVGQSVVDWINAAHVLSVQCTTVSCASAPPFICDCTDTTAQGQITIIPAAVYDPDDDDQSEEPTTDGKCASCSASEPAPGDEPGACLIDGACVDGLNQTECEDMGGVYFATDEECDAFLAAPPEEGACCFCDGGAVACVNNQTEESCLELIHAYKGGVCVGIEGVGWKPGQTCADDPCTVATGACVFATGDCNVGNEVDCTDGLTEDECNALHFAAAGCATNPNVVWLEGETCAGCSYDCELGGTNCVAASCP